MVKITCKNYLCKKTLSINAKNISNEKKKEKILSVQIPNSYTHLL